MDSNEMVSEARSWIGTKWVHGQSLKGVGTDCVQLVVSLAKTFGWLSPDFKTRKYTRDWALHNDWSILKEDLSRVADQIVMPTAVVGDVVVFKSGRCAGHMGLYIGNGQMIHSQVRQVVSEDPVVKFMDDFDSVWRFHR